METDKKSKANNVVKAYKRYLKLQRGYSANTLDAYLRDLEKLLNYLEEEKKRVQDVQLSDLQHFAASLHDIGIHPRSQCRILSGVRAHHRSAVQLWFARQRIGKPETQQPLFGGTIHPRLWQGFQGTTGAHLAQSHQGAELLVYGP